MAYAVFAALWILLSDKALERLISDTRSLQIASTLKGWLFVAVTTLLLYWLLRRWFAGGTGTAPRARATHRLGLPLALIAVLIVAVAGAMIANTLEHNRAMEIARLQTIADLKTRQISDWLRERHGDAEFVRTNTFMVEQYRAWVDGGSERAGSRLQATLEQTLRNHGFSAVVLLDPDGRRLWGTDGATPQPAPALLAAVREAARERKVHRGDPYIGSAGHVRLDFVVPLTATSEPTPFVVLQADPSDWLFTMLQSWPVPSASGETYVFKRMGDEILFLNDLRHRKDATLKLVEPVNDRELLAAKVLRGDARAGVGVTGRDYRGAPVVGVGRQVPGTDWFLVAKIDEAELYQESMKDAVWIGLTGLLALFMAGSGLYLVHQREQLAIAASTQQSQAERLRTMRLLDAIAESSNDAIFVKDVEGRYVLFNRAACEFVGKPVEDVLGRDDRAIFPAEQAEMIQAIGRKVVAENRIQTLEEVLTTSAGQRVFLATKGPLHDADGTIIGIFGISRDITERKAAENALRESEVRFRTLFDNAAVAMMIHDRNSGEVIEANRRAIESYGYENLDELQQYGFGLESAHSREESVARIRKAADEGPQRFEWTRRDRQGRLSFEEVLLNPVTLNGVERVLAIATDITARKNAEETLRQQAEELAQRNAELERFNRASVGRELDMIELKRRINALSRELARDPPFPLSFDAAEKPNGSKVGDGR